MGHKHYIRTGLVAAACLAASLPSCRKSSEKTEVSSSIPDILAESAISNLPELVIGQLPPAPRVDGAQLILKSLKATSLKISESRVIEITSEMPVNGDYLKVSLCDENGHCQPDKGEPEVSSRGTFLLPTPLKGNLKVLAQACARDYRVLPGKKPCGPESEARVRITSSEDGEALNLVENIREYSAGLRSMSQQLRNQFTALVSLIENTPGLPLSDTQADILFSYAKNFITLSEDEIYSVIDDDDYFTSHILGFIKSVQSTEESQALLKDNPLLLTTALASLPSHYLGLTEIGKNPGNKGPSLALTADENFPKNTISSSESDSPNENTAKNAIRTQVLNQYESELKSITGNIEKLKIDQDNLTKSASLALQEIKSLGSARDTAISQLADPKTSTLEKKAVASGLQGKAEINILFAQISDPEKFATMSVKERIALLNSKSTSPDLSTVPEANKSIVEGNRKIADISLDYKSKITSLEQKLEAEKIKTQEIETKISGMEVEKAGLEVKSRRANLLTAATLILNILGGGSGKVMRLSGDSSEGPLQTIFQNVSVIFDQILLLKSYSDDSALSLLLLMEQ